MLYLDPDTAGALVDAKPIGDTSRPLGYYMPIGRVSAVADVDNFTIDLAIPSEPVFNPIYARHKPTSPSSSAPDFTNLSLDSVGRRVVICGSVEGDGAGSTEIGFTYNGVSSGYEGIYGYPNAQGSSETWTIDNTNTSDINVAREPGSSNKTLSFDGRLWGGGDIWAYSGQGPINSPEAYTFQSTGPSASDITNIAFNFFNLTFDGDKDFIDLIINQMPDV